MSVNFQLDEDEDRDPVGPRPRDPVALFTQAAVDVGLLKQGDKLDQNVIALCMRVVDAAAAIGDQYRIPDMPEDTVGDHIRAELYD
ncbi:MAG: hypothetical protein H7274_26220 [Rhodoferax sp.]|nr:hypothetical protein [Rhodoferax sp.]